MQKDKFLNLPFLFSRLHLADDNCDVAETFQSFSQQDLFCRWQNVKAVKTPLLLLSTFVCDSECRVMGASPPSAGRHGSSSNPE